MDIEAELIPDNVSGCDWLTKKILFLPTSQGVILSCKLFTNINSSCIVFFMDEEMDHRGQQNL